MPQVRAKQKRLIFMTDKKNSKPIKLEWQGNIISEAQGGRIAVKDTSEKITKVEKKHPEAIKGRANIRTEVKGRAGKPVAIIFNFTDPSAQDEENLKYLCSKLKTILACGGTVEKHEVILTIRDIHKLKEALRKNNILIP